MEKEKLDEILSIVTEECLLEDLTDKNFEYVVVFPFCSKYKETPVTWDMGATKGVLIFETLNFVLKFPFVGEEDEDEDDGISYFSGAECKNQWDYCESEVIKYKQAKEEGLENIFLEIKKIAIIDNCPIYYQKFANAFKDDGSSSSSKEQQENASKICEEGDYTCFNKWWMGDVINIYGEIVLKKLLNFLRTKGIGDLHDGNIGYKDCLPIILDYGDFCN